ncbi:MAG TPA: hypothetical protein VF749_19495 [Candidatus Acidoferrum sp.]
MTESRMAITGGGGSTRLSLDLGFRAQVQGPETAAAKLARNRLAWSELPKWAFSFPAMLGAILVGRVFYEGRNFSVDPDVWWHIRTGQNIWATHRWPTSDPYSFTVSGAPWMAYEWLGDAFLGAVAKYGGLQGLLALLIVLSSAIVLALYYFAALRSGSSKAGFVSSLVLCPIAFASFTLRPQMFGYLFLILTLIALERWRQGRERGIWFLPPLCLVWVNTHGSWLIGLGLIITYLACGLKQFSLGSIEAASWTNRQRRHLELVLLLCLSVIPITPYGPHLAAYPFTVASSLPVNVGNVLEWQSMPFNLVGGKIFLAVVLGFFLLQMVVRSKFHLAEILLFFGGTAMACLHLRFVILFVPFFAPVFAVLLRRWAPPDERPKDQFVLNCVIIAMVVAGVIRYFPSRLETQSIVDREFPARAVSYLKQHPVAGPMYNAYGFGGYLIWALPEKKVFIDGRGDLYELGGAFGDYLEIAHLRPAAFALLKAYRIQSCLLERSEPLATVLAAMPEWQTAYSDDGSVLYVRRNQTAGSRAVSPPKEK